MTQARCFNCNVGLPVSGKSMEELMDLNLPLFCCTECSLQFPNNGTPKFTERMDELKRRFSR